MKPAYEITNAAGRQVLAAWKRGQYVMLSIGIPGSKNHAFMAMTSEQATGLADALSATPPPAKPASAARKRNNGPATTTRKPAPRRTK